MVTVGNFNTQLSVVVKICYFLGSTLWGGQTRGCDPYFLVQETEIYIDWVTCPESQHSWVMGLKQDREMIPWGWRSLNPWTWDCALDTQTKSSPHSLPTSSLPKDAAGRQLVPRGAWPKRMAQISAQLLTQSLSPNTLPFPQIKTLWWTGRSEHASFPLPSPSAHDSIHCCFAMRLPGGQVTTLNDQ